LLAVLNIPEEFRSFGDSDVDVTSEIGLPERFGKIISTGTPIRRVYTFAPPSSNINFKDVLSKGLISRLIGP